MNIDWFTFGAQIVNFLILVILLRWLLYRRVIDAMDKREAKIADSLHDAEREKKIAHRKANEYEQKIAEVDRQRSKRLEEVSEEAKTERERLISEARTEATQIRQRWLDEYVREREDLLLELREQTARLGADVARHALHQLADVELEQQICRQFLTRLQDLNQERREEVAAHLERAAGGVSIRSSFRLNEQRREMLTEAIQATFGPEVEVAFDQSDELICGLELDAGGISIGWNARQFVDGLEVEFDQHLKIATA